MAETAVDFLLDRLNEVTNGEMGCLFSAVEMNRMYCLHEDVEFLRNSLKDLEMNRSNEHEEVVKHLLTEIRDVAYEAADVIDLSLVNHISQKIKKRSPTRDAVLKFAHALYAHGTLGGVLKEKIAHFLYPHPTLSHVLKQIKSLKEQVMKKLYRIGYPQVGLSSHGSSSSRVSTALNVEEDTVVGFDHEAEMLKERLTGMSKQLQVISIIGMAGLGKTTLARKLYNDPFILYHFYIRGWTCASQVYRKRDVLLGILITVFDCKEDEISRKSNKISTKSDEELGEEISKKSNKIFRKSDEELGEELYKCLKGNRYLVVIDDMWHIGTWNDLRRYFPNDNNGSRVLFTSRHTHVALHANHDGPPHYLRFLNANESWDLLRKKIFWEESCPPELMNIGIKIARKCQGVPLAIVVVAGLLAKSEKNQDLWEQVADNLSPYLANNTEQCMDILALSYNSLPHHLKSCFLYFGVFPEDYEISVWKLIGLWIAEGFIHRIGHENKSLEDVAEDYLKDLIDRNLVLVAKRKSTGGIRACRVHDLLHDLCVRKAKEENFLQQIYGCIEASSSNPIAIKQLFVHYQSQFFDLLRRLFLKKSKEENSMQQIHGYHLCPSSSSLVHIGKQHRRLCVNSHNFCYIFSKPFAPHIRSLLCFVSESSLPLKSSLLPKSFSFIYRAFKLLRVLDFLAIPAPYSFPREIIQLFLLRYLALPGDWGLSIPASIGNLWNLEILIISHGWGLFLPDELWNIATLRHLHIEGENNIDGRTITVGSPILLVNLQTILDLPPTRNCQGVLARTLNLRKLGFHGRFGSRLWLPDLDFLNNLETLRLLNTHVPDHHGYNLQGVKFPPNLKSLTLSNIALDWKEMSFLGMLPNLEVLKLKSHACIGSLWETSDGGFRRLKYLSMCYLNVEQWNISSIHFPSLQHLVLQNCCKLKEIPSELGYIYTLHTIEVRSCSDSVINSAVEIQKEQEGIGNDSLKIIILNPLVWESHTCSVCVELQGMLA